MLVNEKYLEEIEKRLLPKGASFSGQQKEVILNSGSANVVAGPGSGKTTVLTAKCALLLTGKNSYTKGTCLITHTNVAVDEIKISLNKIGIKNIDYPNFIGTIQEFFNRFFTKKAFHKLLGDRRFRVLEDEEYRELFEEYFEINKPHWYTYRTPNVFNCNPKLRINGDSSFHIISNANSSYKEGLEKSIEQLFKKGLVTNKQCLELAKWYINNNRDLIRKAISQRFHFVLLDEAQDTNELQYTLLNEIFYDNDLSFQRYGDPYQALYNIYEDNSDAWVPSEELEVMPRYDISETSRFSEDIAKVVRNLCIEKYHNFRSLNTVDSFKPHFIIYENNEDLVNTYRNLISEKSSVSEIFSSSTKKDAILSVKHDDLTEIFSFYTKPTVKVKKSQSRVKQTYDYFLSLIAKAQNISVKEIKGMLENNHNCKSFLSLGVKSLLLGKEINEVQLYVEKTLAELSRTLEVELSITNLRDHIGNFQLEIPTTASEQMESIKDEFYVGTIHSVKGETHRSTLLLLNSVFEDFSSGNSYNIVELIREYLVGNYQEPYLITDGIKQSETYKALKLAYVALSRPSHLITIGIPKDLADKEFLVDLCNFGWVRYQLEKESIGIIN
ncbi:UvrD-helicase domain-containing protein [Bacillus spizizenii]|nr:UvrD-helicase domain-containing protein [Bacillus spizizenii]MDU7575192.1 UvrD-helicase domain-containing protein [Bacillus subtilis]MCY7841612.1 UvrD-helicase domain-containing protein [Bacillus spizizenii]MCY7932476.1 UvrD-helicase domain-containing protein [Bacillus spizizenii]MCY8114946.1 UvrD-helicase domain-containing protein [Bacillus spizizenii]